MDPLYILFLAAVIFTFVAQIKVSTTFKRYSRVAVGRGQTGAEVARRILDSHGLYHVRIERVAGNLTDHYDPRAEVLRLSNGVHDSSSSAAVGVAAHEVGHAIQHAEGYLPVIIRGKLVPTVTFASKFAWVAIILGILIINFSAVLGEYVLIGGIILFAATTLFHLVTLPCEINASGRAMSELELLGWYSREDLRGAKKVLSAAAMTYIAALATSVIQLLRLLSILGGSRRR